MGCYVGFLRPGWVGRTPAVVIQPIAAIQVPLLSGYIIPGTSDLASSRQVQPLTAGYTLLFPTVLMPRHGFVL